MKIEQKAIEEIQNQFKCIGIDYTNNKDVTAIAVAHGEMAEAVIKALEKQIPKKPIYKENGNIECPSCNCEALRYHNYCWNCGQASKWGGATDGDTSTD